jgi:hypothetical protein
VDEQEREELLDALTKRLRVEGAPQGVWLVELAQAREHLRFVDGLLRKLVEAIVDGMPPL